MKLTRKAMWEWLERTGPPRSVDVDPPSSDAVSAYYEVSCQVGSIKGCGCNGCNPRTRRRGTAHGVTLAQSQTFQRAHVLRAKYQDWLDAFEAAEAKGGECGD